MTSESLPAGQVGPMSFGELLHRYRRRAGLTQEALAEQAGLSGAAISALEQGLRRSPYPRTVEVLSVALELSAEESAEFAERTRSARARQPHSKSRSGVPSAATLPQALTRLIGRETDVREVQQLLGRSPLVTLVGPGGIGKTRLALELGARGAKRFRDGVYFADLSPIDNPTLVPSVVAAAVGVREQARASLLTTLAEALRLRHILLILDNCEHLIHAAATLAQQLLSACPRLALLATSREPLAVAGELLRPVAPLAQPDESSGRSTGSGPTACCQSAFRRAGTCDRPALRPER